MSDRTAGVVPDINNSDHAWAFTVLLHPHPHYGGDRFHPFIDALFRRLPTISVHAVRFDFSSAEDVTARGEVAAAIEEGASRWPQLPAILVGYSFGAGIAARVEDDRIDAWYLLAPPLAMLANATISEVRRPKAVVIPQYDQFSPPSAAATEVVKWQATTFTTVPDTDHFLGVVEPIVEAALIWIGHLAPAL
jgi:alpha/beta superfamily hydrolase